MVGKDYRKPEKQKNIENLLEKNIFIKQSVIKFKIKIYLTNINNYQEKRLY